MADHLAASPYFDLIISIVNIGKASRVLEEAKKMGITGGTITIAHGTVSSGLLRRLGLLEVRKEVLFMVSERKHTIPAIDHIVDVLRLNEPNKGIIFSTALSNLLGTQGKRYDLHLSDPLEEATHELFFSVVPVGEGNTVVDVVKGAGGAGATIMHGFGAFAETVIKVFGIEISSEKDIVLNLVDKADADQIEDALVKNMNFDEKDTGILFSVDAHHVRGVYTRK